MNKRHEIKDFIEKHGVSYTSNGTFIIDGDKLNSYIVEKSGDTYMITDPPLYKHNSIGRAFNGLITHIIMKCVNRFGNVTFDRFIKDEL